ncbi:hypothetical protein [Halovenus salina]|uniref:Uncharacterized protein n=1 Tax=Halovenus salina TaxID=1510225 RepID=A0ABD5W114_9EURY|nr:hypothetical protein [Halovenus salina]
MTKNEFEPISSAETKEMYLEEPNCYRLPWPSTESRIAIQWDQASIQDAE